MLNKKFRASLLLTLSCLALTSCGSEAISKPNNYDDSLVSTDIEIEHNSVSVLYDKIHDSEATPGEVRNELEKILSYSMFGEFKIVSDATPTEGATSEITLVGFDGKSNEEKVAFVNSHPYYQDQKVENNKVVYIEATSITPTIEARINFFKEKIYSEVVKKLFTEANNSSYKYRGKFDEKKFVRAINAKFMSPDVGDGNKPAFIEIGDKEWFNDIVVDYTFDETKPETIDGVMLHVDRYADYINYTYIPEILEILLTEQYIYDEVYSTIGRTLSRKVSYIQLTADNITADPLALMKNFADEHIYKATADEEINYTILQEAYKGDVFGGSETEKAAKKLLESSPDFYKLVEDKKCIDGNTYQYFEGTNYGKIINEFSKLNYDDKLNDETLFNDFTNSGLYTPSIGLELRLNDLSSVSYTKTDSWASKENGFEALSEYSTLLYDYTLSSNLHEENPEELKDKVGSYLKYINGHYFLLPKTYDKDDKYDFILKNGKTYTIVEVTEAVTQSYLDQRQTNYELGTIENFNKIESVARTIGYTVASKDTYKNTALSHYLKKSSIKYYDQSIYEYFKENLPELFE